ncbi:hypothetical protein VPH35_129292 [Triticum aestivum]
MLKFLSRVVVEYRPLDPRKAAAVELLVQCNGRKAKDSNPTCSVELRRLPSPAAAEDPKAQPPSRVLVTYLNGSEKAFRRRRRRHCAGHARPDPRPRPPPRDRAALPRGRGEVARHHPRGGARHVIPRYQGRKYTDGNISGFLVDQGEKG